jgi:hypothetical protein
MFPGWINSVGRLKSPFVRESAGFTTGISSRLEDEKDWTVAGTHRGKLGYQAE